VSHLFFGALPPLTSCEDGGWNVLSLQVLTHMRSPICSSANHYRYGRSVLSSDHNVGCYPRHHPNLFADKGELVAAANPFPLVVSTVAFLLSSVFGRPADYSYQFTMDTSFAMLKPMKGKLKAGGMRDRHASWFSL
jgi:hypothetical protein